MFAVLFTWIIILYIFFILGKTIIFYYSGHDADKYSTIDTVFVGLCVSGSLIAINSLFLPSGFITALILFLLAVICNVLLVKKEVISFTGLKQQIKNLYSIQRIWLVLIAISFVLFGMVPPQLADTFYYHIQNIMWNDEYSVVPGLANLHDRFGFNSNIFLFYSTFGFKSLFGQYIFAFNTLCFALVIIDVLLNAFTKKILFAISCGVLLLFYFSFKLHIGAPSSDLLVSLFIIYLMLQLLRDKNSITRKPLLFFLIPIFCITLKVSAGGIVILALIILISLIKEKSYKKFSILTALGFCIVLPWLIRNVIISGYLIYPFSSIDIFSFDWKIPADYAIDSQKYIKAYAISTDAFKSSDLVLNYPFSVKFSKWIEGQSLFNLLLSTITIFSICYGIAIIIVKRIYKKIDAIFLLWIIALISVMVWIISAPDIRFIIGFIAVLIIIPFYYSINLFKPNLETAITSRHINIIGSIFVLTISILSVRYFNATKDWREPNIQMFYKPDTVNIFYEIREVIIDKQITVNNLSLYLPVGACLDCPLPCSRDYVKNIEMRGESLQDGFREKHN